MKTLMMTVSLYLLCACLQCRGQHFFRLGFDVENGVPKYTFILKDVTPEGMVEKLTRIAKYHPANERLLVVTTARVSAADLLGLLLTIRECGLHNIIVSSPVERNGVEGRITIAMDVSRDVVYGCGDRESIVGFRPSSNGTNDEFLELEVNPEEKDFYSEPVVRPEVREVTETDSAERAGSRDGRETIQPGDDAAQR